MVLVSKLGFWWKIGKNYQIGSSYGNFPNNIDMLINISLIYMYILYTRTVHRVGLFGFILLTDPTRCIRFVNLKTQTKPLKVCEPNQPEPKKIGLVWIGLFGAVRVGLFGFTVI